MKRKPKFSFWVRALSHEMVGVFRGDADAFFYKLRAEGCGWLPQFSSYEATDDVYRLFEIDILRLVVITNLYPPNLKGWDKKRWFSSALNRHLLVLWAFSTVAFMDTAFPKNHNQRGVK